MTIFESSYLKIQYNEATQAIWEEWQLDFTQMVVGDNFRQPLEKLIAEIEPNKASKWLCDNTEQKTIDSKDQRWLEKTFYPELLKKGIKKVALVNAKSILGTGYAKNCLRNLDNTLNVEVFNRNDEAKAWLAS